jgi:solute carrier family 25 protein 33/36
VKQALLNSERQPFVEGHPLLHVTSAACAGFTSVTVTNPVWFVKTRLQLDESRDGSRAFHVIRKIWREKGLFGFYKGITASYFGVTETALYFAIYEQLKRLNQPAFVEDADYFTFLTYFTSAGFSKSMAACVCYPHEVARTRLRQEGTKYRGFFQTLALVFREEGTRGLYKGLATHLVRQIPNTAIVMTTYELVLNYVQTRGIVSGDNGNDNIEDGE